MAAGAVTSEAATSQVAIWRPPGTSQQLITTALITRALTTCRCTPLYTGASTNQPVGRGYAGGIRGLIMLAILVVIAVLLITL
jgi:hypothetical protein